MDALLDDLAPGEVEVFGTLSVLNIREGDMKFSFDPADPQEAARASRVVQDMLKRGYMLFVQVDGKLVRVKEFDATKCLYVIADGPEAQPSEEVEVSPPSGKGGKRGRPKGIPARSARATGVAPTAGG